jgi:uncharacterized integral membrane protein
MIHRVLLERGISEDTIELNVGSRREHPWRRAHKFWNVARWLTIVNTVIVIIFNTTGLAKLLLSDHIFKGPLLFLVIGSIVFGFIIGFKLSTHVYHGSRAYLLCGFPLPVGTVDLTNGEECPCSKFRANLAMSFNALVGVNMTLFPLILIYICLG